MNGNIDPLTKENYTKILQKKRRDFVHTHFKEELIELYATLVRDANEGKNCHFEAKFAVPGHFDIDKTEATLRDYLHDQGYQTIAEPRKDDNVETIVLTLT